MTRGKQNRKLGACIGSRFFLNVTTNRNSGNGERKKKCNCPPTTRGIQIASSAFIGLHSRLEQPEHEGKESPPAEWSNKFASHAPRGLQLSHEYLNSEHGADPEPLYLCSRPASNTVPLPLHPSRTKPQGITGVSKPTTRESIPSRHQLPYRHYMLNFFRCSNIKNAVIYGNISAFFWGGGGGSN
jgi:hypothetical protein